MTDLVDHVTLRMPTFIPHIAVDLDELLQDGTVASRTFCCEAGGIVVVAVDIPFVLIIRILRAEYRVTHGACEIFYVELFVCGEVRLSS